MLKPYLNKGAIEVGCDEAGRGCLAGPVYAAAVILPKNYKNEFLDDSKKLSEKKRNKLKEMIKNDALAWAVASVDNNEIDKINILNASVKAMHSAIEQLKIRPEHILVDGNRFKPYQNIPHKCIIKGDGKYMSIAAASILAKTFRDEFMRDIHIKHPEYHWDRNKGYPTILHRKAIAESGITKYHRKTFKLLSTQKKINFN
ncbi:MAG: ribonuclease HII [Bacteroidetes bacterium]|nr:MAG: ribonuclease HII [Bacteroidota bacterium]